MLKHATISEYMLTAILFSALASILASILVTSRIHFGFIHYYVRCDRDRDESLSEADNGDKLYSSVLVIHFDCGIDEDKYEVDYKEVKSWRRRK